MSTSLNELLAAARALAQAGEWRQLSDLLRPLAADPSVLRGELVLLFGEALARLGTDTEAREWLAHAASTLLTDGDHYHHRHVVNLLGVSLFGLGRLDEATKELELALDLANQAGDLLLLARAANNLGALSNLQGRHETALSYYRIAIPTYQQLGNCRGIAETHHNMAITLRDLDQLELADEEERMAMDFAGRGISPRLVTMSRIGRAEIALRRGDSRLAEMTARSAIQEALHLDDEITQADALRLIGTALDAQSEHTDALEAFDQALSLARKHGHVLTEAETLRDRATAYVHIGRTDAAMEDAHEALVRFDTLGVDAEKERLIERFAGLA